MNKLDKDFKLIVTSTYMAEPMKDAFSFWEKKLGCQLNFKFSSINSIFNQLVDPSSEVRQNKFCNVFIVRFDDWYRAEDGFETDESEETVMVKKIRRNLEELIENLTTVAESGNGTYMIFVSPAIKDKDIYDAKALEKELIERLSGVNNVYVYPSTEVEDIYEVADYYDSYTDAVGYIPYKQNYFDVFATLILRKVFAFYRKPYKVVALDCDNTLWKGVIGEDGLGNVKVDEGRAYLQKYMKSLKEKGVLLCLCSKNNDGEVQEAFEKLDGMVLSADDIVSWKINWERKSENLKEIAKELNLGLDSFVFIDDNMAECMEVKMSAPEVLTLTLPDDDEEIKNFVNNIWALDVVSVTEVDKTRTEKYRENAKRNEFAKSTTFEEFINGLELQVDIESVSEQDFDRAYQIMLRINQFNFTSQKYDRTEFMNMTQDDKWVITCVRAKDRFGALSKGIEYQMLAYAGKLAKDLGYEKIDIRFMKSGRNGVAEQFLKKIVGECNDNNLMNSDFVAVLDFKNYMTTVVESSDVEETVADSDDEMIDRDFHDIIEEIASELNTTERIHKAIADHRSSNMGERAEYVAPTNEIEEKIVQIWSEILEVDHIGIHDSIFQLGGESIKAIQILSRVREEFDIDISLAVLFEGELTVARLADATQECILNSFDEDVLASELEAIENMSEEELEALLNGEI